jgi:hypothetical protein
LNHTLPFNAAGREKSGFFRKWQRQSVLTEESQIHRAQCSTHVDQGAVRLKRNTVSSAPYYPRHSGKVLFSVFFLEHLTGILLVISNTIIL